MPKRRKRTTKTLNKLRNEMRRVSTANTKYHKAFGFTRWGEDIPAEWKGLAAAIRPAGLLPLYNARSRLPLGHTDLSTLAKNTFMGDHK